jgi:monoamine oxidase
LDRCGWAENETEGSHEWDHRTIWEYSGLKGMPPKPEPVDVIVIGGGVSGLAAALELSKRRCRVVLLEARPRLGGRIDTQRPPAWPAPVEMGAEFIHVGNPDLWHLMKRAGAMPRRLPDRHWLARGGSLRKIPDLDKSLGSVTRHITHAKAANLSFAEYFARYPARVRPDAWMLARGFVEGFEAAPLDQISARSLAGEAMDDQHQFIVPGGYDQVIARLVNDCASAGVRILREMVVRSVTWRKGSVTVRARDLVSGTTRQFAARASVVSLPLGVLKARCGSFPPSRSSSGPWTECRWAMSSAFRCGSGARRGDG